jgi:alanyl-tRNA synthetase
VDAYKFLAREHLLLNSLTEIIKGARVEELPERISDLMVKIKEIEKELSAFRSKDALGKISELASQVKVVKGVSVITAHLADGVSGDDLRAMALDLRNRASNSVVALLSVTDGKSVLVVATTEEARGQGLKAGALVKLGSTILGGGGGGKDDFAQGGGVDSSKISQALEAITNAIAG